MLDYRGQIVFKELYRSKPGTGVSVTAAPYLPAINDFNRIRFLGIVLDIESVFLAAFFQGHSRYRSAHHEAKSINKPETNSQPTQ